MTIKEYCESNEDYRRILDVFTQDYIKTYNKRRVAQRKEVKIYLHRNFGYWYYTNLDTYGEASPANFINSDVTYSFKQQAMVFPVCKPIFKKEKLMDLQYTFNVFSLEDHPFIKDLATLIRVLRDYTIQGNCGLDWLSTDDCSNLVNDDSLNFAFRELSYMDILFKVSLGLNITTWQDTEHYSNLLISEEASTDFFALTIKEQLIKIVSVIIDTYATLFKDESFFDKAPSANQLRSALKKDMICDDFFDKMFGELTEMADNEYLDDLLDISSIDNLTEEQVEHLKPQMEEVMKNAVICATTQRYFFLPVGQYLQLIQPLYSEKYPRSRDDEYLESLQLLDEDQSKDNYMTLITYMTPPDCYKLSPLGVALFRDGKPYRNSPFSSIPHKEYKETLEKMLDTNDDFFIDDDYLFE